MLDKIDKDLKKYYEDTLSANGASAKGVGWKNEEAQRVRFEQLAKVVAGDGPFSVNDLGCGLGDLIGLLDERFPEYAYHGYDVLAEMIELATRQYGNHPKASFSVIADASAMQEADYSVASGIFNLRYGTPDEEWLRYILESIGWMNRKSHRGFAFNALTKYSDPEYMQAHLYYSDPLYLFDYCKRNFAKDVALLHDYQQYDFTIIVRKH